MERVELEKIESEYKKWIEKNFGKKQPSSVDELINTSLTLFKEIKVNRLAPDEADGDMLLFQYGSYGRGFEFNITRQFITLDEDEPHQLSMTLFFEPVKCGGYNCWSTDFANLEKWVENIKGTEGYKQVKESTGKNFEIYFEQC